MSEEPIKVFVVDDDALSRMIIVDEISDHDFIITEFEDGQQCLNAMDQAPDIILMDVEMPIMNGHTTCRTIKEKTQETVVMFISSHDTIDEKLAGYDAGGSDYIIKPIQSTEIKQKLNIAIKNIELRKNKPTEAPSSIKTTVVAISNANEQDIILDFMRRSALTKSIQQLAELIVEALKGFDLLYTTVQIRSSGDTVSCNSLGSASPLEIELLDKLQSTGQVQEHRHRLVTNSGGISLLIQNMSKDDGKRGQVQEHLALLLEGAEARLASLETNKK